MGAFKNTLLRHIDAMGDLINLIYSYFINIQKTTKDSPVYRIVLKLQMTIWKNWKWLIYRMIYILLSPQKNSIKSTCKKMSTGNYWSNSDIIDEYIIYFKRGIDNHFSGILEISQNTYIYTGR